MTACARCGREQPTLTSPCPQCGHRDDSESSIPTPLIHDGSQTPRNRGGDSESNKRPQPYFCNDCGRRFYNIGWHCEACGSSNYEPVTSGLEPSAGNSGGDASRASSSPVQIAFMRAHRAWAQRFQPWLLMDEEWLNA
jgi:ribosomal protein L37E